MVDRPYSSMVSPISRHDPLRVPGPPYQVFLPSSVLLKDLLRLES